MVPIMFLAMVGPMLKSLAHVLAAFTSAAVGLALAWMPSGTGLLVAAFCAVLIGTNRNGNGEVGRLLALKSGSSFLFWVSAPF